MTAVQVNTQKIMTLDQTECKAIKTVHSAVTFADFYCNLINHLHLNNII